MKIQHSPKPTNHWLQILLFNGIRVLYYMIDYLNSKKQKKKKKVYIQNC